MPDVYEPVQLDTRLAGQVKRYHTWPVLFQQTVADHSWNVLRIYLCVEESPNIHMIREIMFHDIGEIYTGDLPYPIKRDNGSLKEITDRLEHWAYALQLSHWDSFHSVLIGHSDRVLLKQIELIEMAEFGMHEMCLGNNHGYPIANRCLKAVYEAQPCPRLAEYVIIRLELFYRQFSATFFNPLVIEEWWNPATWKVKHASERNADRGETLQD